jgi:hypothetical protein
VNQKGLLALGSITIMPRQKREKGSARERSLSVPESLFGGGQCDETSRGSTSFPIISASLISSHHFPAFSNISCPSSSRALGPLPFPQKLLLLQEHRSSTLASRPAASCMHSRRHACCMHGGARNWQLGIPNKQNTALM